MSVKTVSAYTPPYDADFEQRSRHRSQIASARSRAQYYAEQAERTGALATQESAELTAILAQLGGALPSPYTLSLAQWQRLDGRAAEGIRRAREIADTARRRADAIKTALAELDRACTQDLSRLADSALRRQGESQLARLAGLRDSLKSDRLTAAEATEQRSAVEAALARLHRAQGQLDQVDAYAADLLRLDIDCATELAAARQRIQQEPAQAGRERRAFERWAKASVRADADQRQARELEALVARYEQWGELRARMQERQEAAEAELRTGEWAARDAVKAAEARLDALSQAVQGFGAQWDAAAVGAAFVQLDTALAAVRTAVGSRQRMDAEVEQRAGEHVHRLQARLGDMPDLEEATIRDLESRLDRLRGLSSPTEVNGRAAAIKGDVDRLAAAAGQPVLDPSAHEAVIAALASLGARCGVDWIERDLDRLRKARFGQTVTMSGRMGEDSSFNLTIRLSQGGPTAEGPGGVKLEIGSHDAREAPCRLIRELPQELAAIGIFEEISGHDDEGVWREHRTETRAAAKRARENWALGARALRG